MIDYILIGIVCLVLFFAIKKIVKNKKSGGCGGCSGCNKADCCSSGKADL